MKKFYEEIEKKMAQAEKAKPVYESLQSIIFDNLRWKTKPESVGGHITNNEIDFMHNWENMPIVVSVWDADDCFIQDYILSVMRFHWGVSFDVEVWSDVQKILYETEYNGIKIIVQSINQKECTWEEVPTTTFKLNCAA